MTDFEKLLKQIGDGKIQVENKTESLPDYPKPSHTKVNNMTIIIKITSKINVDNFYENIKVPSATSKNASKKTGIVSIKAGKNDQKGLVKARIYKSRKKDLEEKKIGSKKATKKNGTFRNQVCVGVRPNWISKKELESKNRQKEKKFNVKLFKNGTLHMTGPPSIEDAFKTATLIIKKLRKTKGALDNDIYVKEENYKVNKTSSPLKVGEYKISLINAGFSTNFKIDRTKIHKILTTNYHLESAPHKPSYQAVNTKFFYNETYDNDIHNGICHCKCLSDKEIKKLDKKEKAHRCKGHSNCNGLCSTWSCSAKYKASKKKGNGLAVNDCRCVSILIFGSGEVLITGGTSFEQVKWVYKYINKVFKKHYDTICIPPESGTYIKKDGVVSKSIVKLQKIDDDDYTSLKKEKIQKVKIVII